MKREKQTTIILQLTLIVQHKYGRDINTNSNIETVATVIHSYSATVSIVIKHQKLGPSPPVYRSQL